MIDARELGAALDSLRRTAGIPGLAVAVLRDGEIVLLDGLGVANVETATPVTPNTPFNIASVTKPMSAVVAMRLVEDGRMDLDAPMSGYADFEDFCFAALERGGLFFDDWACDDPTITLRHVLSMTSNGTLGTRFFYNPVAYSWASRPMAEVGGAPFSELVDSFVFRPAGMNRSARTHRALPLPSRLERDLAAPHHTDGESVVRISEPPPPQGDGAAGGVITTVEDMVAFDQALDAGQLLSRASIDEMWRPAGDRIPYGLGWFADQVAGVRAVWHTGLWEGAYSALYLKVPDHSATLILLANSDGLRWEAGLDEAGLERSPFARAFFEWLAL